MSEFARSHDNTVHRNLDITTVPVELLKEAVLQFSPGVKLELEAQISALASNAISPGRSQRAVAHAPELPNNSLPLPPRIAEDPDGRRYSLVETILLELRQKVGKMDLPQSIEELETVISATEILLPCCLAIARREPPDRPKIHVDQHERPYDAQEISTPMSFTIVGTLVHLLRNASELFPSAAALSSRLASLVFVAVSALARVESEVILELLRDITRTIKQHPPIAQATPDRGKTPSELEHQCRFLHLLLTGYPRRTTSPSGGDGTSPQRVQLVQEVRRLESTLAMKGVDERLGLRLENACLAVLELCWLKLDVS